MDRILKAVEGHHMKTHPTVFYLFWRQGTAPRAEWIQSKDMPKEPAFGASVKWKEMRYDVYLATDYHCAPEEIHRSTTENPYKNTSFLKSHLQKSIRRSNSSRALKTATHFADLDMPDFLRRLVIIALEDALPLEGFSVLMWFTSAVSKGYRLSPGQFAWILGYIHDLCKCKSYMQYPHHDEDEGSKGTRATPAPSRNLHALIPAGRDLVYSILFRQAYGGMKGDARMCSAAATRWATLYHSRSAHLVHLERTTKFITYPTMPLGKSEWFLAALDFHPCPSIIGAMWEKHDEFSEEEIRSAIWHCSSSVTDKVLIGEDGGQRKGDDPALVNIWRAIKKDFMGYAKFMLDRAG